MSTGLRRSLRSRKPTFQDDYVAIFPRRAGAVEAPVEATGHHTESCGNAITAEPREDDSPVRQPAKKRTARTRRKKKKEAEAEPVTFEAPAATASAALTGSQLPFGFPTSTPVRYLPTL